MARSAYVSIDGKSSTDQGGGYPQQSMGSKTVRCDLDAAINWWRIREMHPDPVPRDLNGVPHRWCSGYLHGGHYSPLTNFSKNGAREDGKDNLCKQCRHELYEYNKVTAKAAI